MSPAALDIWLCGAAVRGLGSGSPLSPWGGVVSRFCQSPIATLIRAYLRYARRRRSPSPPCGPRNVFAIELRPHKGTVKKQPRQSVHQTCPEPCVVVVVVVVVLWCGTICNAQVSVHLCARVQLIKKASTIVLASSAGLFQPEPPTPVASESRFQAFPSAKSPNPKAKKKIARHTHLSPLSFGGRGGAIFSISSALSAQDLGPEWYAWTRLLGKPDPFTNSTINIQEMTNSTKTPFTNPKTNLR